MATVIYEPRDERFGKIGQAFGEGLSQGVASVLRQRQAEEKAKQLENYVQALLKAKQQGVSKDTASTIPATGIVEDIQDLEAKQRLVNSIFKDERPKEKRYKAIDLKTGAPVEFVGEADHPPTEAELRKRGLTMRGVTDPQIAAYRVKKSPDGVYVAEPVGNKRTSQLIQGVEFDQQSALAKARELNARARQATSGGGKESLKDMALRNEINLIQQRAIQRLLDKGIALPDPEQQTARASVIAAKQEDVRKTIKAELSKGLGGFVPELSSRGSKILNFAMQEWEDLIMQGFAPNEAIDKAVIAADDLIRESKAGRLLKNPETGEFLPIESIESEENLSPPVKGTEPLDEVPKKKTRVDAIMEWLGF